MCNILGKKFKEWRQAIATSISHPSCWSSSNLINYFNVTCQENSEAELKEENDIPLHLLIYTHIISYPALPYHCKDMLNYSLFLYLNSDTKMSYFTDLILAPYCCLISQ